MFVLMVGTKTLVKSALAELLEYSRVLSDVSRVGLAGLVTEIADSCGKVGTDPLLFCCHIRLEIMRSS